MVKEIIYNEKFFKIIIESRKDRNSFVSSERLGLITHSILLFTELGRKISDTVSDEYRLKYTIRNHNYSLIMIPDMFIGESEGQEGRMSVFIDDIRSNNFKNEFESIFILMS